MRVVTALLLLVALVAVGCNAKPTSSESLPSNAKSVESSKGDNDPITQWNMPAGYEEPQYTDGQGYPLDSTMMAQNQIKAHDMPKQEAYMGPPPRFRELNYVTPAVEAMEKSKSKKVSPAAIAAPDARFVQVKTKDKQIGAVKQVPLEALHLPLNSLPGPWFGSYSTRMDELGYSVPPYAFDPKRYAVLGPYRALTSRYSDGTPYPLNMEKFDSYWSAPK